MNGFRVVLVTFGIVVASIAPFAAIRALARSGVKPLFCGLVLMVVAVCIGWFSRGIKEHNWRMGQSLHIRWNAEFFGEQYMRLHQLGDENLRHAYVTNFSNMACILLNYDCKYAPNTSNLVERYYSDWDERIEKKQK